MELYSAINCDDRKAGLIFWRHPGENFKIGSVLTVAENEEALFMQNGVIVFSFSGGRTVLETENYPFIAELRASASGGVNTFTSKVYFINKAHAMELLWGTDAPIQVSDPKYAILAKVYARGSYSVKVEDSKKFFDKFVDENTETITPQTITAKFSSVFMQKVKSMIVRNIRELGEPILDIAGRLDEFAELAQKRLSVVFEEYGLRLVNFYFSAVDLDEEHASYATLIELQTHAATKKLEAEGDAGYMERLGANYKVKRGLDIVAKFAEKPPASGAGAVSSLVTELPQAVFAMNMLRDTLRDAFGVAPATSSVPPPAPAVPCASCGKPLSAAARFCGNCRAPATEFKVCPKCNASFPSTVKFCEICGETLS